MTNWFAITIEVKILKEKKNIFVIFWHDGLIPSGLRTLGLNNRLSMTIL